MLLNKQETAAAMGKGENWLKRVVKEGAPKADVKVGRRRYYTPGQLSKLRRWHEKKQELCAISSAAKKLGISLQTFKYHLVRGSFSRPTVRIGNRMFYTLADVRRIGRWFKRWWKEQEKTVNLVEKEPAPAIEIDPDLSFVVEAAAIIGAAASR